MSAKPTVVSSAVPNSIDYTRQATCPSPLPLTVDTIHTRSGSRVRVCTNARTNAKEVQYWSGRIYSAIPDPVSPCGQRRYNRTPTHRKLQCGIISPLPPTLPGNASVPAVCRSLVQSSRYRDVPYALSFPGSCRMDASR